MESSSPDPDADLFAYLEGMGERLRALVEDEFVRNPDDIVTVLERDASFLQESIETIMSVASPAPHLSIDLNQIVDHACRELLFAMDCPIVITSSKDPLLPGLPHPYELLLAAVLQALQLTAEHAGQKGELFVATSTDGYHVAVQIRSSSAAQSQGTSIEQRVVSLSDLIEGIGGSGKVKISVEPTGEVVEMSLSFETRVSTV